MFQFSLVTPEKKLVTDVEVEEVIVPAYKGQLDILPGHSPLETTLSPGILKYRLKGESNFSLAALSWGYCEVSPEGVKILAETAETPEDIDRIRAERALKEAEAKLSEGLTIDQVQKYQRKVQRARVRLDLVK
jgi:F-type H+-transporting ATPase subunit epsilon